MPDLWDYRQRWRRRWQGWRRQGHDRLQAWQVWWVREQAAHNSLMEGTMDVQQDTEVAMARAIREQMSQQTAKALKAAMREEILDEVKAEAVELAKVELQEDFDRRRERLQDNMAKVKVQLEDELERELDRREEQLRQEVREHYDERLLTLKDDLTAATSARDQATTLLVSLVTQLLAEQPKRYLASLHITELDLLSLNQVLAAQGLRVASEYRFSERQVVCKLKNGAAQRTVFWLEKATTRPGVVAVEAEDQDGGPEAPTPAQHT